MDEHGGWDEWGKHVLIALSKQSRQIDEIKEDLGALRADIAVLKVKSGIWGGLAGLIPVVIALSVGAISYLVG